MFKVDCKTLSHYAGWVQICHSGNIRKVYQVTGFDWPVRKKTRILAYSAPWFFLNIFTTNICLVGAGLIEFCFRKGPPIYVHWEKKKPQFQKSLNLVSESGKQEQMLSFSPKPRLNCKKTLSCINWKLLWMIFSFQTMSNLQIRSARLKSWFHPLDRSTESFQSILIRYIFKQCFNQKFN